MKFSKLTILILTLTLLTLLTWVVYQVYRFQKRGVVFAPVDSHYTQPLDPNLDPKVLDLLQTRTN